MARLPTEGEYITGGVPREMLSDAEGDPTQDNSDLPEGVSVTSEPGLTKVRIPAPAFIPVNPPALTGIAPDSPTNVSHTVRVSADRSLLFDFALLPDVQCHLVLHGPATADHLEQLVDYLSVAVRRLREQEARNVAKPPSISQRSERGKKKK